MLLYFATIVAPVCVLLWLGLDSFELQRQAIQALSREKLDTKVDSEARAAAAVAIADGKHPIARHFFVIDQGQVVEPMLRTPLPRAVPPQFAAAERKELALKRPDMALPQYRALLASHTDDSLALNFIARSLGALGREGEARDIWRTLARQFPDDRDLAGRPYGIVAAINAGDTAGLFEQISSGRWNLSADQAAHFLTTLDPERPASYLERFEFARTLETQFKPATSARPGEIEAYAFAGHRVFYREDGPGRIVGFEAAPEWMAALEQRARADLNIEDTSRQAMLLYGGAIALVLLTLSAGTVVLLRDVSRDARMTQLRADFVNGVTHDLKTPVSIMRLYGETLLRQRDLNEADRRDFYRVIARESARLGRLVDQVLTFSQAERGDIRYNMHTADPAPVIAGIVDDYGEWLEHIGFEVERELPPSAPPVRFDAAALSQAVVNLLDNAVKYSGSARTIATRLTPSVGHVTFEVEDHGVGIPAADRDRIFDRFYRAANDTGKGGSGLGLFMVRHIMQAHGGRVEVDSEPGRGSRFRLIFPAAEP
jgi:signal transduction histidine kinase